MGQAGLVENLQGMWCDAVAVLVGWEWPHARQAIWQAGTASTAAAVQAWLQVSTCPCTSVFLSLAVVIAQNPTAFCITEPCQCLAAGPHLPFLYSCTPVPCWCGSPSTHSVLQHRIMTKSGCRLLPAHQLLHSQALLL